MSKLDRARQSLATLLETAQIDVGHGIDHAEIVLEHANKALEYEDIPEPNQEAIRLAALLHDADDEKFFPDNTDYQNTRKILKQIGTDTELTGLVIKMIGLVSCSKNRNNSVKPSWLLIPRFADRLEAMGRIGIVRCWQYTKYKKRPMFFDSTQRSQSFRELMEIATPKRFAKYTGKSESMIDHFYDKLLHLIDMDTPNDYLRQEAQQCHLILVNFCIEVGCTGTNDETRIKNWQQDLKGKNNPWIIWTPLSTSLSL